MKKCTVCKEEKSLDHFYNSKQTKDGKGYRCKECEKLAVSGYKKRYYQKRKEVQRNSNRRFKYGIEPEDYDRMLEDQKYCCAICNEKLVISLSRLKYTHKAVIDHCHTTGKIRGILCARCNQALGLFRDSIDNLKKAIDYLKD